MSHQLTLNVYLSHRNLGNLKNLGIPSQLLQICPPACKGNVLTSVPGLDSSKHFLSRTHTCPRARTHAHEAMKPYPCLNHLNWAPAPPDPTEFKVSREKGPPFPREGPEEEKGGSQLSPGFTQPNGF